MQVERFPFENQEVQSLNVQQALILFPNGRLVDTPLHKSQDLLFPLTNGQWLQVAKNELTERERYLLSFSNDDEAVYARHPWYRFLVKKTGEIPQKTSTLQWIHVHHSLSAVDEKEELQAWLEVMRSLLPNRVADFQVTAYDTIFVLDQSTFIPIQEVLGDTLSAMEFDFGLKLTMLVGQIWSLVADEAWAGIFQAEHRLFLAWQERFQSSCVLSFGQAFLWGQSQELALYPLRQQLAQMIHQQDQLAESIRALWEEAAVVTKAAQRLYVHRNTLQYRLEKWLDVSGLQLRNLTDLAVCYQAVLENG
ncbi:helix-turn-helix domain-containing protein [Streptococcus cuniculi]|uniref:helix-turn-helix domain-containing protein n=1 Tax=Streptococcus cuniculi TaxID=1432788 RepID=UPI0014308F93|nr:helix-turn-helix domain-containing protein [Streptococcus cuniculi]